jgi:hypothetical protein
MFVNKIKFIDVIQAKDVYRYKIIEEMINRTIVVIWVNELCETYRLTYKLVNIMIKGTNKLCQKRWKQPSPFELIKNTAGV